MRGGGTWARNCGLLSIDPYSAGFYVWHGWMYHDVIDGGFASWC
jgi:hypothetical protein